VLAHNPINLDLYHKFLAASNDQLNVIRSLTADNSLQKKYLDEIEPLLKNKVATMDHSIAMEQSGDHAGALQFAATNESGKNMIAIEDALENMQVVQTQELLQGQNHYQHDFKLNALLSLIGIALSLGFIFAIILLLRRLAQLQSMVTLTALTDMMEYEGGSITIEEYLKRRHKALAEHGQAQIEAERLLGLLERRKNRPVAK
jgi:hypothetical protein